MSLAQRRTILDGIEATSPKHVTLLEGDHQTESPCATANHHDVRVSAVNVTESTIPKEDSKEVWQNLSYDAFAQPPMNSNDIELQHDECSPPEVTENLAAYEVSTTKRMGEFLFIALFQWGAKGTFCLTRCTVLTPSSQPAQVAFAVVACVLASGIVCGFAALKPILIAEGVYRSLCPADWPPSSGKESAIPCPEQDMRLNLFFITASITLNVGTVLAGYVLDHYGRRACYLLSSLILFLGGGCMTMAFYFGPRLVNLDGYITGNLLLGLGGTFLFVSSYQLSNAFPRYAGLVVALVTGAFDASAAVFLFYRLAYEATPHHFKPASFFLIFAIVVPLLIVIAELTLMPAFPYTTRREYQVAIAAAQDPARDVHDSDDENYARRPTELRRVREHRAALREEALEAIETVTGDAEQRRADREAARDRRAASGVEGILQTKSVGAQMATPWFVLLMLLTVCQMTRMNYFIATMRAQYRYMLGSEAAAENVNGFFDVALPVAGVVTTPFIGLLLNEMPVRGTLGVLTVLIVVLGVLNCIAQTWAAYAAVVAFVLFRPLYYSAVSYVVLALSLRL